jgi:hypothetical protein
MLSEKSGLLLGSQSHVGSFSANNARRVPFLCANGPAESDVKAGLPEGLKGR